VTFSFTFPRRIECELVFALPQRVVGPGIVEVVFLTSCYLRIFPAPEHTVIVLFLLKNGGKMAEM